MGLSLSRLRPHHDSNPDPLPSTMKFDASIVKCRTNFIHAFFRSRLIVAKVSSAGRRWPAGRALANRQRGSLPLGKGRLYRRLRSHGSARWIFRRIRCNEPGRSGQFLFATRLKISPSLNARPRTAVGLRPSRSAIVATPFPNTASALSLSSSLGSHDALAINGSSVISPSPSDPLGRLG